MFNLVLAAVLAGSVDSSEALPSLETIRNSYLAAVTPIFSLHCEMRLEIEASKQSSLMDSATRFSGANIQLWRKGNWRAIAEEFIDGNNEPSTASWYGFDGNLYGHWGKSLRPMEKQDWLPGGALQAEKMNELYESFTIDRLTGETLRAGDLPLASLLGDPAARVVAWNRVAGVTCLQVEFPRHMSSRKHPDQKTVETTVWLDPKHSYLPRLIRSLAFPRSGTTPPQLHEYETTEFRSFTGEDGRTYTLPSLGERRMPLGNSRLKLIRATINGSVSDRLFKPDYPPLTEVLQRLPNQQPHRVIVGDPEDFKKAQMVLFDRLLKAQTQKDASAPSVPSVPPSARPRDASGWRWSWWIQLLGSLIIVGSLVIGVRVWRTRNG